MPTIASGFRLANNVKIPCIGLGTWQVPDDEKLIEHIHDAINIGYRHIDTAFIYGNEAGVGEAIRTCGVPREQIFVTTKLWNADRGYDAAMRAFDNALQKMDLSYLDMFLIHWPAAKGEPMTWQSINSGTWRALEDLYEQGAVKVIGVSNFLPHHLVPLLARARIRPMVNQLEIHPGYPQFAAVNFCFKQNIAVQAWSPLGRGGLTHHPLLIELGEKYGVSPALIALRWSLQHGFIPVVKALDAEHMKSNLDAFGLTLEDEDMTRLDTMQQVAFSGLHPDTVTF